MVRMTEAMNRREFVRTGVAASVAASLPLSAEAAPRKRMNILYVFSDQQRACSMPGKPFSDVVAPNLDAFAKQNFVMENCISNYPLCTPYRAIFMSGRWPQQTGVTRNGPDMALKASEYGLGQCFKDAGYNTGYAGKWHLAIGGERNFVPKGPLRFGFDYFHIWGNTNNHWHDFTWNPETGERIVRNKWNATAMTDDAVVFLEQQKKDKPWLLVVSWNPPHPPYDPPKEDADLYDAAKLQQRPNVSLTYSNGKHSERPQLESEATLRAAQKGYYGGITGVDKEFARLLATLEKTGQADNTIVIFTSDHGDMMGTHARMAKQVPWEESCHVPFYIRIPGAANRGKSSSELLASIDIYPTLCGLAGIPVPKHCSGHDRSSIMLGHGGTSADHVILMSDKGLDGMEASLTETYRGIRTATHTYAVVGDGRWLLYDNVADPYQVKNLAGDPKQAPLIKELDEKIMAWQKVSGDTFPLAEAAKKLSSYPT